MAGAAAIRQAFAGFLASKPKIKLQTRYAIRMGDLALLRAQWAMAGMDPNGQPLAPTGHSSTEVVRRQPDGTWRYVIDHPFGAD
jgi:ketosteroid isomerase-like protein